MKIKKVRENLPKRKTRKKEKQGGILISKDAFTQLFKIQLAKYTYSWIFMKILEIIDKTQKKNWVYLQKYSYRSC